MCYRLLVVSLTHHFNAGPLSISLYLAYSVISRGVEAFNHLILPMSLTDTYIILETSIHMWFVFNVDSLS